MLTDAEVAHLDRLLMSARADTAPNERLKVAEEVTHELQMSHSASVALAIASVATRNARDTLKELEKAGGETDDIGDFSIAGECACAGAIVAHPRRSGRRAAWCRRRCGRGRDRLRHCPGTEALVPLVRSCIKLGAAMPEFDRDGFPAFSTNLGHQPLTGALAG